MQAGRDGVGITEDDQIVDEVVGHGAIQRGSFDLRLEHST